jgi:hypothetical protein
MAFHDHRPNRRLGRSEKPLIRLTRDLTSFLYKAQRSLAHDTLHLSRGLLHQSAWSRTTPLNPEPNGPDRTAAALVPASD